MIPPRLLVMSGGGIKVTASIGALKVLEQRGHLKSVKEVCGVSAGAWIAFMIACRLPVETLERLILELDFGQIRNLNSDSLIGFPETFGLDDGSKLINLLNTIFRIVLKIDPEMTFADMAANPSNLAFRCWAMDLHTGKERTFSLKETPNVKIIEALRASMSLPLYFTPPIDVITGHMLTDGGIQGNIPLQYLTHDECNESLSIGFSNEESVDEKNPEDLMGFLKSIMGCVLHQANEEMLKLWNHKIIRIPVDNYPSWNFEASREDRNMLLTKGITATESWLSNPPMSNMRTIRRLSI